jgi:hypothetical protein
MLINIWSTTVDGSRPGVVRCLSTSECRYSNLDNVIGNNHFLHPETSSSSTIQFRLNNQLSFLPLCSRRLRPASQTKRAAQCTTYLFSPGRTVLEYGGIPSMAYVSWLISGVDYLGEAGSVSTPPAPPASSAALLPVKALR